MKKEREVIVLHEISISVTLKDGARGLNSMYAVYQTGKNFIKIPYNDPNAEKYSFAKGYRNLSGRVPVSELMLVQQPSYHDDETDCVRRYIYCLEKDQKKAVVLLQDVVDKRIDEMKKEMDILHGLWKSKAVLQRA